MKKITAITLAVLSLVSCVPTRAADNPPPLDKAKSFAFGGVGVAGTISSSELSFREVMNSANALKRFHAILESGTNEAKLYALCGIRALDPGACDSAAAALIKSDPQVETISGCMIGHQGAAGVIKNIRDGRYDACWRKK